MNGWSIRRMALWLALDAVPYRLRGQWWLWLVNRYDMRARIVLSWDEPPVLELVRPADGEEQK